MRREDVNPYVISLLSFVEDQDEARALLIELGSATDSAAELAADWVHLNDLGLDSALRLKTWLGLDYQKLGLILGLSTRELARLLRSQRLREIGPYSISSEDDGPKHAGLSCFMAEQQLSSWIDCEWEDRSGLKDLRGHLSACSDCSERLVQYRQLESRLIAAKKDFPPISVEEWEHVLENLSRVRTKRRLQLFGIFGLLVLSFTFIIWFVTSQPKETPNIYEIEEAE